jgi:glyoxylase-like metal-dependent hydrolase (beta-lactamase superfamily II)
MQKLISFQAGMSNAFYIVGEKGVIAVDSGADIGEEAFLDQCKNAGIEPGDIKLIIITHGHVDHFMNLPAMKAVTGAPILCHKDAAHFLINGEMPDVDICGRTQFGIDLLEKQAKEGPPVAEAPKIDPDIIIDGEYDLNEWGVQGKIIHTPGHSRGCISVVLDSGEAIVGDLFAAEAFHEDADMPYFCYPGARFEEAQESVQKLLDLNVQILYSGHGNPSPRAYVIEHLEKEKNRG